MCFHSHADHDHDGKSDRSNSGGQIEHSGFWKSKAAMVMMVFAAIGGFFLITEHWAHLYGILPFLLVLACPLMHIFMHHGHGGHHRHQERAADSAQAQSQSGKEVQP